jgi:hypothetical protein
MSSQRAKKETCAIPAVAGIQEMQTLLDPGDPVPAKAGSGGDGLDDVFRYSHSIWGEILLVKERLNHA